MTELVKTRSVMNFITETKYGVLFSYLDDEGKAEVGFSLTIPKEKWEDLGRPQEITISIERGNVLEAEAQEENHFLAVTPEASVEEYSEGKQDPVMFVTEESPKVDYRAISTGTEES